MRTKKQKVLMGVLIPVSTVAVAGSAAAGVVYGINKSNNSESTLNYLNGRKITFSAGEGKFVNKNNKEVTVESGTKFDRVDQPIVKANKSGKTFAGWVDDTGKPVYGQSQITKDMKLHAIYNDDSDEYVTVTFALDQTGPTLQGNLNVSVNKGYFFYMVNRPSAKWVVTDGTVTKTKYFKGWKFSDGTMIQENQEISSNITLYPVFTEAVTVKWDAKGFNDTTSGKEPPAGHGEIERGQDYTTLESGTLFNLFNQPGIKYAYDEEEHEGNAYFAGWYTDTTGTTPVSPSTPVTSDMTVYAKWSLDPEIGDKYGTLTFSTTPNPTDVYGKSLPTGMTFSYTPTDKIVVVLNDKKWGDTNKPTLLCYNKDGSSNTDYKVDHWEIQTGTSTWEEIGDEFVFTEKTNVVRPVLTYAIDSISVYGSSSINVEESKQYSVQVIGGASSSASKVTWELVTDLTGTTQFPQGIAQIDSTGLVTVKSVTRDLWEQYNYDHFYVKATSQLDTSKVSYFRVGIDMPYNNNNYIWIHTVDSEPTNPKWYHANIEEFCDNTKGYVTCYGMDGTTTKTFNKTEKFNDTLTFGTNLSSVPDNFLKDWINFSGAVDFAHSNIITVGENFMAGCTSFNNLIINLNGIKVIKANFLKGCTSYNQPIEFISNAALVDIGDNFLGGCTSFNSKITFPTINPFYIENNFLYGCTSYNQPLELPNIVLYVGAFFMTQCNAFCSKLTVNCPMENFVECDQTLASTESTAGIYTYGFSVGGTQAENFKQMYQTVTGPLVYRTVLEKDWDGEVTTEQFKAAQEKLASAYNVTISFGSDEVLEYNASSSNASDWDVVKMIWNDVDTYIVKDSTKNNVELQYKSDGSFYKSIATGAYGSPTRVIDLVHKVVKLDSTYTGGTWTLDTTNKWYTYEFDTTESEVTYNNKVLLRFNRYSRDIEYLGWYYKLPTATDWSYHILAYISNIGTTETITKPTMVHNNTATWVETNTRFECSDSTAVATGTNSGFSFKITNDLASNMPTSFAAWVYTTDATKGLAGSFNESQGARVQLFNAEGKIKNITTKFDETTYKIRISCDQAFEVGDVIYVTATGAFDASTNFIAVPMYTLDFTSCDWSDIIKWAEYVEEGTKTTDQLCAAFDDGFNTITSIAGFAGLERTVTINGLAHKVRCIEVQHAQDLIVESGSVTSKKATFTFETVTLLSKADGSHYSCTWGDETNYHFDYSVSVLQNNLDGTSKLAGGKSAYTMLTEGTPELVDHIKTVQKNYSKNSGTKASQSFANATFNTRLFALTCTELHRTGSQVGTDSSTVYTYWNAQTEDSAFIKYNYNGSVGYYWTSSPRQNNDYTTTFGITDAGKTTFTNCYISGYGLNFAFCI